MKRIIHVLGILILIAIICLNLLFTANLDASEHISIINNSLTYVIGLLVISIIIFVVTNIIDKYLDKNIENNNKKYLLIVIFFVYILFNIIWIITVNPKVIGDSVHICNLAQAFYRENVEEILSNMTYAGISMSEYIQSYHQQIPLAFIFSMFFRIIRIDIMETLRILNVIGNILIIVALYKINMQLSKKYKTNKVLLLTLICTFLSLLMLSTFIYGDIPSLALCLFSVYFTMKYVESNKKRYIIYATIFSMVAYMMRMNSLIFIIATVIYLILNILKTIKTKPLKESILNVFIIIIYVVGSIVPSILVENYYLDKYNINKNSSYPYISYILMGMEESSRGNGWYNEKIAEEALNNKETIQEEYTNRIKERLNYFSQNISYTFNFYVMKIASMWTENTYSAIRNNMASNNSLIDIINLICKFTGHKTIELNSLEDSINPLTFYQKSVLILMCLCSLIILIQNRKNLSLELIFLLTIFIGGFMFHILWEAKSRYIIPYIVILMPISSIKINKLYSKYKNHI